MKKILFISYDATRTGAPILLLHILRWLKANTSIPMHIVLRRGGELLPEFEALGPTQVLKSNRPPSLAGKIIDRLGLRDPVRSLRRTLNPDDFGLIYANTMSNGDIVAGLNWPGVPVLTHVHELAFAVQHFEKLGSKQALQHSTRFIACAEAVKTMLMQDHGVEASRIDVVHGCMDGDAFRESPVASTAMDDLAGIPPGAFVVGACGRTDWRKGADLFIQLALQVSARTDAPIHFVWVGGMMHPVERNTILHDLAHLPPNVKIHFVGNKIDPKPYYQRFDVFALMSREDPFPLVCLEAAACGKPILCFDQAGGMPEFVEHDAGFIVPYLDVEAMTRRVLQLYEDASLRTAMGRCAREKVFARHDIPATAARIANIIQATGKFD